MYILKSVIKRIFIILAVILIIFTFPQKVKANPLESVNVFYYETLDGKEVLNVYKIQLYGRFTQKQKAFIVYSNLLENYVKGKIPFTPEGLKLNDVEFEENIMILNVSGDVRQYEIGSQEERLLMWQLIVNAWQFSKIDRLSITTDDAVIFECIAKQP